MTGDVVQAVVVQSFEGEVKASVVWEGKVPHDSDYKALDELGAELGYEILEVIARQKPWEVLAINIVKRRD